MKRLLFALLLTACDAEDTAPLGVVRGTAWFLGPVAGAPVTLHLSNADGSERGLVASGVTGDDGGFHFDGLDVEAPYRVRVELAGRPWRTAHTTGTFAEGDRLQTATGLVEPYSDEVDRREHTVSATPLSTLVLAAGESLRMVNREVPLPEAQRGARIWLGFDPLVTPIGPRDGALDDAVRHTLVLDSFDALADAIATVMGVQPGTAFNPPDLLRFLVDDALGLVPAGQLDGIGSEGPLVVRGAADYVFSPDTLQSELRDALDRLLASDEGPWGRLAPGDVQALRLRLSCSGSKLFPQCRLVPPPAP
jgi:hypothetical protein